MLTNTDPSNEQLRARNAEEIESWRNFHDLPVPLIVELGRTVATARVILELDMNSIVQLPRSTGEGVDVIAGEHLIARGEIVMIEDRTGVRINEITTQSRK